MKSKLLLLISLFISVSLFSQNKTGIGNVSSTTGVLIPNAIVKISPISNPSLIFEYVCDKNGNYIFNIESLDNDFSLNILPSVQTLQFTHNEETISLSDGDNGILFQNVELTAGNGILFTVIDTAASPVQGAKINLYDTKSKWRIDSCRIAKSFYTDSNGQVEINSLLPVEYWFNIRKDYMNNRFTVNNYTNDTTSITNIEVTIRDLTTKEFYMCGLCDNKTWITDSIVTFGISTPYDADSKLLSDGTWYDSNDNHGYWWFSSDETSMTYDYDSNSSNGGGSTVDADLIELTDNSFVGDMAMLGIPVTYYMSANYDVIDLNLTAYDTTIYLDNNGQASLSYDDLMINSSYCFTCTSSLSQSSFDTNDIGNVDVYITLEDRCGNSTTDTITVTIAASPYSVNKIAKSEISIYPNPVSDFISIKSNDNIRMIEFYSVNGQLVKQMILNKKQVKINTSDINNGFYFCRIYTSKAVVTKKIVVEGKF